MLVNLPFIDEKNILLKMNRIHNIDHTLKENKTSKR